MRYIAKTTNHNNLMDVFTISLADEYQEAMVHLNRLIRDPTVLKPGTKSIVLITPLNTNWEWNERKQNIEVFEDWSENCQMSEITIPISMDQMIQFFLDELNDDSAYANDENMDRRYGYQRSLRKDFIKS